MDHDDDTADRDGIDWGAELDGIDFENSLFPEYAELRPDGDSRILSTDPSGKRLIERTLADGRKVRSWTGPDDDSRQGV